MATIWVPATLRTCAGVPASDTASGPTNPWPKIVTWVPPVSGPWPGAIEEMNIAWPYWNGSEFETLPVPTLVTVTPTVVGVPGWLAVMLGAMQTTWLKLLETTCACCAPKSTCTGYWKPAPVMVTRVPPSSGPRLGVRT